MSKYSSKLVNRESPEISFVRKADRKRRQEQRNQARKEKRILQGFGYFNEDEAPEEVSSWQ